MFVLEKQQSQVDSSSGQNGSNSGSNSLSNFELLLMEKENHYLQQISELESQMMTLQTQVEDSRISSQTTYHLNELEQQVMQLQQQQPNWERQITEIIEWVGNEKEARNYLQQMAATMTKELENLKQHHQYTQQRQQMQNSLKSDHQNEQKDQQTHHQNRSIHQYLNQQNPKISQDASPSSKSKPPANTHLISSSSSATSHYGSTTWQERRSARVDKQELLQLQLDLANEIEDKQRIQVELARVQRELNSVVQDLNETKHELLKYHERKRQSLGPSNAPSILFASGQGSPANANYNSKDHVGPSGKPVISAPLETHFMDSDASDVDGSSATEDHSSSSDVIKSSQSLSSQKQHSFVIRTFVAPLKCNHCTSLMVGLIRQGLVCEVCGFACHVTCANQGSQSCPCDDARQRPVGIDPLKGIGTAYEGYVKIPKARGGVRKGWIRMFVVVCDFKLFLYDLNSNSEVSGGSSSSHHHLGHHGSSLSDSMSGGGVNVTPFVSVNTLIDMR